jgi:hypothetical protein
MPPESAVRAIPPGFGGNGGANRKPEVVVQVGRGQMHDGLVTEAGHIAADR